MEQSDVTLRRWLLRVLSGPLSGTEVQIAPTVPLVIGRADGANLILDEGAVSRRHAVIELSGGDLQLKDLGSTNGTFVNGARVESAALKIGDRVVVGGTIFEVGARAQGTVPPPPRRRAAHMGGTLEQMPWMVGRLDLIPIADLLQLFGTLRKSGVLRIDADRAGTVLFDQGEIVGADVEGVASASALKPLFRILAWAEGSFRFEPPEGAPDRPARLEASVQELLLEGYRQQDELDRLRSQLPSDDQVLVAGERSPEPTVEAALVRLAVEAGSTRAFLDAYPRPDLEAAEALLDLLARRLIAIR
ncbi:MAG: DUF4388 domain-containing protein [Deltaproteobacteria bacterium]|nr:DUF4388 domain-containing protein [Deltaproteobacteria bacterium]